MHFDRLIPRSQVLFRDRDWNRLSDMAGETGLGGFQLKVRDDALIIFRTNGSCFIVPRVHKAFAGHCGSAVDLHVSEDQYAVSRIGFDLSAGDLDNNHRIALWQASFVVDPYYGARAGVEYDPAPVTLAALCHDLVVEP